MENIFEKIRKQLIDVTDEKYLEFNRSLVPGDNSTMLGVRVPRLREFAKSMARENGLEYVNAVKEQEKQGKVYHEELLLHGMIIGYMKCSLDERKRLLDDFVPVIDSWAVCDSSCMTYKFMKKDMDLWFEYLMKYLDSTQEYELLFAIVSLLDYFVTENYIERVLRILGDVKHEAYYVKMAVAWAVSVCYVKFPELTWDLLAGNQLDDITHQKSIQKIRESFRVSKEEKERLNTLRRAKKG